MFILQAQERQEGMKPNHLRKNGFIPGNLYGFDIENSLSLQIARGDVKKLMKSKAEGGKVLLNIGGEEAHALLREVHRSPLTGEIGHLSFQKLDNDRMITSTARVVLVNRDKAPNIQQLLFEIPYRALASKLVETIEIDLDGVRPGDSIKVKDLEAAKDEEIELLMNPESLIAVLAEKKRPAYPER